jgi:carbon storage regulator
MLVLSRRANEKIVFPSIQTEVHVLGMKGGQVRLGIEGPRQVTVLRQELSDRTKPWRDSESTPMPVSGTQREIRHRIRNHLNEAGLCLALLRQQLEKGHVVSADLTLEQIEKELQLLQRDLEEAWAPTKPLEEAPLAEMERV